MKRKILTGAVAFALALVLVLAGCQNPSSSDSDGGQRGVLGLISGVVYDTATGLPLEGVTVEVNTGISTKTDKFGTFKIDDLKPGDYQVAYQKDGYQYAVSTQFTVDAENYKDTDPFGEFESLTEMLNALNTWAVRVPDAAGGWTFSNGVWLNGDGTTAVTLNPETFEVTPVKIDYDWRYHQELNVQGLVPLTGAIKGTIKLVKTPFGADLKNWKLDEAVAIQAGVEVWLRDNNGFSLDGGATTVNPVYGPVKTAADGSFSITKVPLDSALEIFTGGFFTADGYYFAPDSAGFAYDYATNAFIPAGLTAQNNGNAEKAADQTYTIVDDTYLFTKGSYALITAHSNGNAASPLDPKGAITLTFSKAIEASKFIAILDEGLGDNFATTTDTTIILDATWNAEFTTVTLKPKAAPQAYLAPVFPYSDDGLSPLGYLKIQGYAADGSKIFADIQVGLSNDGIPVYVTEGLRYLGAEIVDNSSGSIARGVAVKTTDVIKLNFSKELDSLNVDVTLGGKTPDWKVDGKSLYVFTDTLRVGETNQNLFYNVVSAADSNDRASDTLNQFADKAIQNQKLALKETNLVYEWNGSVINVGADGKFPVTSGSVTLTFTRNIPAGATVKYYVVKDNGYGNPPSGIPATYPDVLFTDDVPATIATTNDIITITPSVNLSYNTIYYIAVQIEKDKEVIFGSDEIANYDNVLFAVANGFGYNSIAIGTVPNRSVTRVVDVHGASDNNAAIPSLPSTSFPYTSISGGTVDLTAGAVTLYVTFNNPVKVTTPPTATQLAVAAPYDTEVKFEIAGWNSNTLRVTVSKASGATAGPQTHNNVHLNAAIPGVNTAANNSGTFDITNLTVKWN
jgi:hypothetical protein